MSKFLITPEEIEIIKELRLDAIACKCSISEYLNSVVDLAHELVLLQNTSNNDNGLVEIIRTKIELNNPSLSNWSIGENGEIIKGNGKN